MVADSLMEKGGNMSFTPSRVKYVSSGMSSVQYCVHDGRHTRDCTRIRTCQSWAHLVVPLAILPQVRGNGIARDILGRVVKHGASCVEGLLEGRIEGSTHTRCINHPPSQRPHLKQRPGVASGETGVSEEVARHTQGVRRQESSAASEIGRGVRVAAHCNIVTRSDEARKRCRNRGYNLHCPPLTSIPPPPTHTHTHTTPPQRARLLTCHRVPRIEVEDLERKHVLGPRERRAHLKRRRQVREAGGGLGGGSDGGPRGSHVGDARGGRAARGARVVRHLGPVCKRRALNTRSGRLWRQLVVLTRLRVVAHAGPAEDWRRRADGPGDYGRVLQRGEEGEREGGCPLHAAGSCVSRDDTHHASKRSPMLAWHPRPHLHAEKSGEHAAVRAAKRNDGLAHPKSGEKVSKKCHWGRRVAERLGAVGLSFGAIAALTIVCKRLFMREELKKLLGSIAERLRRSIVAMPVDERNTLWAERC